MAGLVGPAAAAPRHFHDDEASPMMVMSSVSSGEHHQNASTNSSNMTRNSMPVRASSSVILASLAVSFAAGVLATILMSGSTSKSGNGSQGHLPLPMLDSTDNDNDLHHKSSPRRSFVCITGQLERLELDNKINSVLFPLRAAGYEPDIALVLDDSSLRVTNGS